MQIKITIDDKVLEALEKEADKLGLKLNTYIQLVLGKHVQEQKKKP